MEEKIKLGISSCLLGNQVRYDAGHKLDRYLRDDLGCFIEWVPVCPEVECGLPVPREAMHLVGAPVAPRLVSIRSGVDHTERMRRFTTGKLDEMEQAGLCGFVFKSKSPSSGMRGVKIYTDKGMPSTSGSGLFAAAFMARFPLLPVEDEGRLNDWGLRENFIERVFVMHRWRALLAAGGDYKALAAFHTRHKLLIMSHGPAAVKTLGAIIAGGKGRNPEALREEYLAVLMPALALKATARKNTNVLDHVMGYFKKQLTPDEKKELKEVIADYHAGILPLIVPVTLLRHYVRKFDEPYLKSQVYLHPHPAEL
ncbi:MAG: DUF523 and DUF1722 domain-containing protein, partial [Thermodesulfobacteriota bacterium]